MKALSSISGRIAIGLAALFLSTVVVGVAGWWTSNFAFQALQTVVSDRVVPLKDLKLISDKYAVDIVDASHKMRSGAFDWDKGLDAIRSAKDLIDKRWNAYMATYLTDEEKALAAKVDASRRDSDAAIAELIKIISAKDKAALDTFVTGRLYPAIDPTTAAIGELVDLQVRVAENVFADATGTFTIANAIVVTAMVLSVMAFAFACWVSFRKVLAPLGELTKAMTYLANGNTDRTIPHAERNDEIGAIAHAIGIFQGNAVERQRLEIAAQTERDRERRRQAHVESLINGFRGTMAETLASVGSQTDTMRGTASKLTGVASSAADEANAAGAASSGASRNVQSVAAATEELAASIREIAGQAHQANTIVARATETATATDRNVSTLADAAEKVGAIVDLIRDIAEQTNLLALNATIEAARAGDTGKGFAVVAAEVKSLATQTAKATDDIAAQITGIQSSTRSAVEAIRSINVTVGEISAATTTIAAAVEEQEAATREISKAIQSASDGTSQVASSVVSVNSAIDETSKEAQTVHKTSETLTTVAAALANAVEAFLNAVTSDLDERRAALRVRTSETVSVMVRGRRFNTRLIDLSDSGCRLREVEKLAIGEPVSIDLDEERVAEGRVVRTNDGEVAIAFNGGIKVRPAQAKAA